MTHDWSPLAECRAELDALDAQIITLFAKRLVIREKVHAIKAQHNLPIEDASRVEEVIAKVRHVAANLGFPQDFAEELYCVVIDQSHRFEKINKEIGA